MGIILIIQMGSKYNHKYPYKREAKGDLTEERGQCDNLSREKERDLKMLWFSEGGGSGHEPRKAGSPLKLEKARGWILP